MNFIKKQIKLISAVALSAVVLCSNVYAKDITLYADGQPFTYSQEHINLVVNGNVLNNLPMQPLVFNERTLVPVREIFETLGAEVVWVDPTKDVYITMGDTVVKLTVNSKDAYINDTHIVMDVAPIVVSESVDGFGKVMIPVRFVAENLGFAVNYVYETRTVEVYEKTDFVDEEENKEKNDTDETIIDNNTNGNTDNNTDNNTNNNTDSNVDTGSNNNSNNGSNIDTGAVINNNTKKPIDVSSQKIVAQQNAVANITSMTTPTNGNEPIVIKASSPITNVTKTLLADNRLVIDIENANLKMGQKTQSGIVNAPVTEVRIAQNQTTPTPITRAVLQLTSTAEYSVSLSDNRKELTIEFGRNSINDIGVREENGTTYVTIKGDQTPMGSISVLPNPTRMVIDFASTSMNAATDVKGAGLVSGVRSSQYDNNTSRTVIDINDNFGYDVTQTNDSIIIAIKNVANSPMWYDYTNARLVINKALVGLTGEVNLQSVSHTDDYRNYTYKLELPSNLNVNNELIVNSKFIKSAKMVGQNGKTTITMNENAVAVMQLTQNAQYVYISPKKPSEVYDKIVVIDPGHGGRDPGTLSGNLYEKDVTLDIGNKLQYKLNQNTNIKIYMTREIDEYPTLDERVNLSNFIDPDLYVSVHVNSAGTASPNGVETYYYDTNKTGWITSKAVAEVVQASVLKATGQKSRGVKTTPYIVIKNTKNPAILVETAFISNPEERALLTTDDYRNKVAQGLYDAIVQVLK